MLYYANWFGLCLGIPGMSTFYHRLFKLRFLPRTHTHAWNFLLAERNGGSILSAAIRSSIMASCCSPAMRDRDSWQKAIHEKSVVAAGHIYRTFRQAEIPILARYIRPPTDEYSLRLQQHEIAGYATQPAEINTCRNDPKVNTLQERINTYGVFASSRVRLYVNANAIPTTHGANCWMILVRSFFPFEIIRRTFSLAHRVLSGTQFQQTKTATYHR